MAKLKLWSRKVSPVWTRPLPAASDHASDLPPCLPSASSEMNAPLLRRERRLKLLKRDRAVAVLIELPEHARAAAAARGIEERLDLRVA